jgi:hypothetical protein
MRDVSGRGGGGWPNPCGPAGKLAIAIDLIPDFIPVLGYADDAIVVLRLVVSRAGQGRG